MLLQMSYSAIKNIRTLAKSHENLTDVELKSQFLKLKYEVMAGVKLTKIMIPGFALVLESSRRSLGMVHYDVQLLCGLQLIRGRIAEMKTGEGKTLTASLAAAMLALYGKGLHVVTFNDYLAKRDCDEIGPVFSRLGLSTAVINSDLTDEQRVAAYGCDITYGAANEFGFDFLRDRIKISRTGDLKSGVMRGTNFALIDEADSILIDEARTPLIIGMVNNQEESVRQGCFKWAAKHAKQFVEKTHFTYDELKRSVKLTPQGITFSRRLPQVRETTKVSIRELYTYLENAIKVRRDFQLDKSYAIVDGEILIIDEFTGRPAEGRQWTAGIHQSVQAKEGVEITPATQQAASITIQSFFKRYKMFCGMTGTAWTSRRELKKVYKKKVVRIPTHRKIRRQQHPVEVFTSEERKFSAVAAKSAELIGCNRSVLIGTRTVEKSELLAQALNQIGVSFQLLNARHLDMEADIVSAAGRPGKVTIATNMAGRGTDIKLDESVRQAGGLYVILTEIHESQRIDWQLIGRGSRQGDPGGFQICVSLEDEILTLGLGQNKAKQLRDLHQNKNPSQLRSLFAWFKKAQARIERRYLTDRLIVLRNDVEKQKLLSETGQDPYLNTVSG